MVLRAGRQALALSLAVTVALGLPLQRSRQGAKGIHRASGEVPGVSAYLRGAAHRFGLVEAMAVHR